MSEITATANPVKEVLSPDPDGIVTDFTSTQSYKLKSTYVWINGLLLVKAWDTGYIELGGNTIRMKIAPLAGDSLQIQYEAT